LNSLNNSFFKIFIFFFQKIIKIHTKEEKKKKKTTDVFMLVLGCYYGKNSFDVFAKYSKPKTGY